MSKDVAADSSSATPEFSDVAELFYTDSEPEAAEAEGTDEDTPSESTEVDETASDSEPEEQTETEEADKPEAQKPRTNAEKRILQLLAENKRLKQQAPKPEVKTDAPAKAAEATVEELKAPEPGQFDTWADFEKAQAAHVQKTIDRDIKAAIQKDRQEQAKKQQQEQQQAELAKAHKVMVERQKQTEKRIPDLKQTLFDEAGQLRDDIVLHPVFDNFIPKSEVGWDILHAVAKNPERMAQIAEMDDFQAAGEFHRLQNEITAKLKAPPTKTPTKPSRVLAGTGSTPHQKSAEELFYGDD